MKRERATLIASCRLENRKTLVRMFDELSINSNVSYVAPTIRDARELLGSRSLSTVFCEERLSDGSYCDLLRDVRATWPETAFVVLLCTGEREEYLQATRFGAQEVLRCPLRPKDVDLVLIQAMKGSDRKEMTANA
jgi:DNA-binding NtrC family response regulator